jgi:hypothetical protein
MTEIKKFHFFILLIAESGPPPHRLGFCWVVVEQSPIAAEMFPPLCIRKALA